jgi:hypothetical protein
MKKIAYCLKIIFLALFGLILLWGMSLPFFEYDPLGVLGVYAGISLSVIPPVYFFSSLRRGAAHASVSSAYRFIEIAVGLSLLAAFSFKSNYDIDAPIFLFFGLLFVIHGAVRLPRKPQQTDEHPEKK